MGSVLIASAMLLSFLNGANDNLKGVATLYGSGSLSYRRALALATVSTGLGSVSSIFFAGALIQAFSGKGILPDEILDSGLLAAVAMGAALTILLATRIGMPVSTTHALIGGLVGAGWIGAGSRIDWLAVGGGFALPLLASPAAAMGLAWVLRRGAEAGGRKLGMTLESGDPRRSVGITVGTTVSTGHLLSGSLVGFARGLNDTPKILGLVAGVSLFEPLTGAVAIAGCMALGGLLAARRVTETLAKRITPMTPGQGLAGNLASSLLVIGASGFGLPVSTTHVTAGGIVGVGASCRALKWRATSEMLVAWALTLPISAALSATLAAAFSGFV